MDVYIRIYAVIYSVMVTLLFNSVHSFLSYKDSTSSLHHRRHRRDTAALCPSSHPYNANGTCVKHCPPEMPLIVKDEYGFPQKPYCTGHCPESMFKNGNYCTRTCGDHQVTIVDTKECYDGETCPQSFPLNQSLFGTRSCSARCPISFIEDKMTNSCILFLLCKQYIFHSSCVDKCPPYFYDSGPENLDQSESSNMLSEKIFFKFRVCLSDFGYRATAIVSFSLSFLIIPSTFYFFFYEWCCRIQHKSTNLTRDHRLTQPSEDQEPLLADDNMEMTV